MLHTDGAPITKIGNKSLWPIQCTIAEIPPPVRDRVNATMIFAVWLGGTHPNRELFWTEVVNQRTGAHKQAKSAHSIFDLNQSKKYTEL
jgi:hypothetical protein